MQMLKRLWTSGFERLSHTCSKAARSVRFTRQWVTRSRSRWWLPSICTRSDWCPRWKLLAVRRRIVSNRIVSVACNGGSEHERTTRVRRAAQSSTWTTWWAGRSTRWPSSSSATRWTRGAGARLTRASRPPSTTGAGGAYGARAHNALCTSHHCTAHCTRWRAHCELCACLCVAWRSAESCRQWIDQRANASTPAPNTMSPTVAGTSGTSLVTVLWYTLVRRRSYRKEYTYTSTSTVYFSILLLP